MTFATIKHVLEHDLGYEVRHQVVNSEHWVPQRRQRIFIVGFRKKSQFDFAKLKLPSLPGPKMKEILQPEAEVPAKYILTEKLWQYLVDYKAKHESLGHGFGFGLTGPEDVARTLSARYYKDGSEILIDRGRERPRRLTPRECARLMGFEKRGGKPFNIVVSDMQAYRQFGNAVVVPAVAAVADILLPHLRDAIKRRAAEADSIATAAE
jgi:DNA (cytosine-5)-methyltransferase 1